VKINQIEVFDDGKWISGHRKEGNPTYTHACIHTYIIPTYIDTHTHTHTHLHTRGTVFLLTLLHVTTILPGGSLGKPGLLKTEAVRVRRVPLHSY